MAAGPLQRVNRAIPKTGNISAYCPDLPMKCKVLGWVVVGVKLTVHDAFGGHIVFGGLSFYPHAHPGQNQKFQRSVRVCVCKGASVPPCLLSCVVGVEDHPPFGDLGCALRHRPAPVLRSHPDVAPVLAARRVCQWRKWAWSRITSTRHSTSPGVPTR